MRNFILLALIVKGIFVGNAAYADTTTDPNYDCNDDEGEDYCSQYKVRGQERLTELDEQVANDSLENDPYTAETKWMLKGELYKKLDENPELQDSLQVMEEFYAELQGSNTAAFKAIYDEQLALHELDSTVAGQLQANSMHIDSLMALVQNGLEEMGDSTLTSTQREAILSAISGYREDIRDLSTGSSEALQEVAEEKALAASNIQTANAAVSETELIESNQKQVNDIYLATIGKDVDVFNATQAVALFNIGNQCPMIGGNAVFRARALYGLIDDTQQFDDSALCAVYGIDVKRLVEHPVSSVAVVPNPAMNEAALILTKGLNEPGVFILYNAMGGEVLRQLVPADVPRLSFSTASLVPAVYHYQVRGSSALIGNGKLTIVR